MQIISAKPHGVIDYLVVAFLLISPKLFGFTGLLANFTYAIAGVHFILTLLTNFNVGLFKVIPMPLHGLLELIVGIALIIVAFAVFNYTEAGMVFYSLFGGAVLMVWYFTDYSPR